MEGEDENMIKKSDQDITELIDDFDNALSEKLERFDSLILELKQEGLTGIVILGDFDQLTGVPHSQWRVFGNPYTVRGQIEEYLDIKKRMAGEIHIVVEDNDA